MAAVVEPPLRAAVVCVVVALAVQVRFGRDHEPTLAAANHSRIGKLVGLGPRL